MLPYFSTLSVAFLFLCLVFCFTCQAIIFAFEVLQWYDLFHQSLLLFITILLRCFIFLQIKADIFHLVMINLPFEGSEFSILNRNLKRYSIELFCVPQRGKPWCWEKSQLVSLSFEQCFQEYPKLGLTIQSIKVQLRLDSLPVDFCWWWWFYLLFRLVYPLNTAIFHLVIK